MYEAIGFAVADEVDAWTYGASPEDLAAVRSLIDAHLALVTCFLSVITLAACLVPAYRAARVSPAEVLAEL